MLNISITNFRKNLSAMLNQTIRYNEPINIATKSGNAVVLSEEEYNGLIETLRLLSNPEMKKRIIEARDTPLEECIPEEKIKWSNPTFLGFFFLYVNIHIF